MTSVVEARTGFGAILRRAVDATPGAIGGAFADRQGEMVDCFARGVSSHDWAVLTAHYGIIMAHLHDAFGIWHYGGPEYFVAQHASLGIVVHAVADGYFALLAVRDPGVPRGAAPWQDSTHGAIANLTLAARALREEMA
jgi:hypothetical protein